MKYLIHRKDDSDQKYGVPELKKFPMPDADHVRSAIKFFNYITPEYEEELARAILKRMKEYGLTFDDFDVGKNNRFLKYMPEKAFGDKQMKNKYLIHHGIAGQKWGQTNGPPYPLDYESHSAKEKKSNPKSLIDGNNKTITGRKNSTINKAIGFDLSKYSFKAGTKSLNCSDNFKDFSSMLNKLIEAYGKDRAAEFLKSEYGFSDSDAKAAVKNLAKTEKAVNGTGKKSGGGSKGGSSKGSGESEESTSEETSELDQELGFDAGQYEFVDPETGETLNLEESFDRFMELLDKDMSDFESQYDSLDDEEKKRLEDELGITNAEEYAKFVAQETLTESYGIAKDDAESIMKKREGNYKKSSEESLDDIFGFDLSKYDFNSNREGTGVIKKNAKTDFDTFASTVQWLLNEYGPDQVLDHLIYEWDFSENDAKSVIENLSKAVESSEEMSHSSTILIGNSLVATLAHHGIDGQKWGVQNGPPYPLDPSDYSKSEKKALKQDLKWIKKNEKKVYNKAYKESKKELNEYAGLLSQKYGLNKNGKLSAAYVNNFNRGMAELMNEKVADVTSPSGRAVRFIAKRGQMGVYTALADQGYDMSQVKNGVWTSGRIAYRKTGVTKVDVSEG